MARVSFWLDEPFAEQLQRFALTERRRPPDQAAFIVQRALESLPAMREPTGLGREVPHERTL